MHLKDRGYFKLNKKITAVFTCLAVFGAACGSVQAMEAGIDYETNLITVSDSADSAKSALVLIREKSSGRVCYADLLTPENDGFYTEFKLSPKEQNGVYVVTYTKDNSADEQRYEFVNVDDSSREAVKTDFAEIFAQTDETEKTKKLDAWFESNAKLLNLDEDMYKSLDSKAKLLEGLSEISRESFADIMLKTGDALKQAYELQLTNNAIAQIKLSSVEEITEILKANETALKINLSDTYYKNQSYVNERLKKNTGLNADNFAEAFNEIMAIPYLNAAERSNIDEVIKQQDKYLKIYDLIHKNSDDVVVKILKRLEAVDFTERQQIIDEINAVVAENTDKPSGKPSGGSSGSSGGGGGGGSAPGGSVSLSGDAIPKPPKTDEKPEPAAAFSDIEGFEWAAEAIENLSSKGIISGREKGIFAPGENITRAEAVKILVSAFNIDGGEKISFSDVTHDSWYAPFIEKASGFVTGNGDGTFKPDDFISRQDIAVMLCRIMNASAGEEKLTFSDSGDISDYAKSAVAALYEKGAINGKEDGKFYPLANLTRAECAKLIYEIIK